MIKSKVFWTLFFLSLANGHSQDHIVKLWPENVPNQTLSDTEEIITSGKNMRVRNVQNPEIQVYLPSEGIANGKAMLLFPGGGYYHMAFEKEGIDVAKWLNGRGIAGIAVKYRLPHTENLIEGHEAPLQDAQRAIRLVRKHAGNWNIDPNQIGVMGFSAGGHLAATIATQYDREVYTAIDEFDALSARPDFACLMYPVISMDDAITHGGSKKNLLGESPGPELVTQYSNEKQVTQNTPPTFLVHTTDDAVVPVANALSFYEALQENGIPAELHVYSKGKHGLGLGLGDPHLGTWKALFLAWLEKLNREE